MKWITAGDIKAWLTANQRHCAQTLPELIRRLILATASTVDEIEFPSGDSISHSSWDGRLKTPVASPLFPTGTSAWEIGTERSPGKKAEEDYKKRTAKPLGFVKKDTVFVFVTPRAWPGRLKWQNEKRAEGVWKDVRVIAADALEQWLDLAPAVALWLARQIKGLVVDIRDIEGFWEEWSAATYPKMTTDIVIGGRTQNAEHVQQWLRQPASILEVRGDSPDEPFAFLYSAIMKLPEVERVRALSRCVLVDNVQQVRSCAATFQNPLIIVAPAECREAAGLAVDKGYHVFLSADSRSIDFRANLVELSRPRREVVEKQLHLSGLSEADAEGIARDFGRSIPVLRRHRFRSSARTPAWSQPDSAKVVIPLLFAGAWDDQQQGDREVIESLSGIKHADYVRALKPFLEIEDSPIRKIGSVWMLKSPPDAWFLIAGHLTDDQLGLFRRAILSVLTKTDPKYELEAEKRWMAAFYGKSSPYSEWVRRGLVESLVMIAVYGDRSPHIASTQSFADRVVKEILCSAQKWDAWASIQDVTPLLAEAAPNAFMDAVDEGLAKRPEVFVELMSDDGGMFGECRHSGMLWALEGLAWCQEYFARASRVLFDLSKIDKGGHWNNRPINSLKDIFVAGVPQTNATAEQRLAAWDALVKKDAAQIWKFAHEYYRDCSISRSHQFKWRGSGGNRQGLEPESKESYKAFLAEILPRLRELACRRENLVSATKQFIGLPKDVREKLIATLDAEDADSFSRDDRGGLFRAMREALNWVNSFGDQEQRKQVPALRRLYKKFTPIDPIDRYGWLLGDPWPRLPEGGSEDHVENQKNVRALQEKAARELLDQVSLERVLHFAVATGYPGVLGHTIGRVIRDDNEDARILDAVIENLDKCAPMVQAYASGRVAIAGPEWIERQVERLKAKGNYTSLVCAFMYLSHEEGAETWSAVASRGKEVEEAYWKHASGYSRTNMKGDAPEAVAKLLEVKRPDAALVIAAKSPTSIPSPLLQRVLLDLLEVSGRKVLDPTMNEYYLGLVFKELYQRTDLPIEGIARLEWPYAVLCDELRRYTNSPMALHRVLQKDPAFFAQLISFVRKRDDGQPDPVEDGLDQKTLERRAQVAYKVLKSWHLLPGVGDDGSVDGKVLSQWIINARKKCEETNHVTGGDIYLGFTLAHAPADSEGTWPHPAVRDVIELLNNDTIDDHIRNEIYNSRGVVTRALDDGGQQERGLADRYRKMSETVKAKWPRTSALLRSLADTYSHEAKRADIDADLRDLRSG